MADYEARVAPFILKTFYVTAEFGQYPSGGIHRGLDIATSNGEKLYSICNGTVIEKAYDSDGYGNYIIIKENITNYGFLYAHMKNASNLSVGDIVETGYLIGTEGTTGNSTGIHLHLEMQNLTSHNWIYNANINTYMNPAEYMGFPNQAGISIWYNGIPTKPEPEPEHKKNTRKWALSKSRKIRIFA